MSQASVRLRELEREVEASRDVYQSFLKRSRETEEQESLNTSNARIIGEATVPQRRTFPPAMSLLAMIGFVFGGLAASGWFIALSQLMPGTNPVQPRDKAPAETPKEPPAPAAEKQPPAAPPQPVDFWFDSGAQSYKSTTWPLWLGVERGVELPSISTTVPSSR